MSLICVPVPGGWQTQNTVTGEKIGPVCASIQVLWQWQAMHLEVLKHD